MKKVNILITGDKGFVGSHLVKRFTEHNVKGYDTVDGYDIMDGEKIKHIVEEFQPDIVYHTAGQAYLDRGEALPHHDLMVNAGGMINLLKALENTQTKLVYTSSGAVYGLSELPHREDSPCYPMCNYGVSKLMAELYLRKWSTTTGVNASIVRFSSVYGGGRRAGPVNMFLKYARMGEPMVIYGGGGQTRDYVHVSDVVDGMQLIAGRGRSGHVYNLGYGEEVSVLDVANTVRRLYPDVKMVYEKTIYSPYDLPRSWFDISKARKLGYNPKYDLELGVSYTNWEMDHEDE